MAWVHGTLVEVPFNNLVALRDVTGEQSYPGEAQQIYQFQLLVSDDDLRSWVRQGQEAAAVIARIFPSPSTSLIPDLNGKARLCRCKTVLCHFSSDRG